jgi:Chitobiase/beta-hexosaminidase C-terminal domain
MRPLFASLSLLLLASCAFAQDPTAQAAQMAQQATQQAMQANQQAIDQMNQATQQANAAMQQANANAISGTPACCPYTAAPKFSIKPGTYPSSKTVSIKDSTRGAIIYYTTDGWTPTAASTRYKGPITVDSTTTITAVAISPYATRSPVVVATYTIAAGSPAPMAAEAVPVPIQVPMRNGQPFLPQGTPVHLSFAATVNSKTAAVGDKIPLTLTDDLKFGDTLIARKGATAIANVIQADSTGIGGAPGEVTFEVEFLQSEFGPIKLAGTATKEGQAKPPNASVLIPGVAPFLAFRHGTDAIIPAGTLFEAFVASDTPLAPAT